MGSLGSQTVNNMMKEILPKFDKKDYEVLFVTGKDYFDNYNTNKPARMYIRTINGVMPYLKLLVNIKL